MALEFPHSLAGTEVGKRSPLHPVGLGPKKISQEAHQLCMCELFTHF